MSQRRSPLRILAWSGLLLILLVSIQQLPAGQRLNLGIAPLLSVLQAPGRWWQEASLWLHASSRLQSEYQQATIRLEQQSALTQEVISLREENRQLRALLGIQQIRGYYWHAAKVQGRSPDKMSQRLILLVQNAEPDDVIVSSDGLVGLVDHAKPGTAVVRTILDAAIAVPVTMPDRALAALVRGQGDRLMVDFVPIENAPEVGSILQTSGAGGLFPAGIPVARVTGVEPIPGQVFARVDAIPVAHWQRESWLAMASATRQTAP
ncbi:MAG: rod shape-determining protein MreC [Mariprofundaceae bacterium]|nr:rod shape-determining protein MreC [Mariprofundaceae bacterium]